MNLLGQTLTGECRLRRRCYRARVPSVKAEYTYVTLSVIIVQASLMRPANDTYLRAQTMHYTGCLSMLRNTCIDSCINAAKVRLVCVDISKSICVRTALAEWENAKTRLNLIFHHLLAIRRKIISLVNMSRCKSTPNLLMRCSSQNYYTDYYDSARCG